MIKLRPATLDDYNELRTMYKDLLRIVYSDMEIGKDIHIDASVADWFVQKKDVIISETSDGEVTGFSVAWLTELGIVEPYYYGDIAYVKEEYRKGRSAYLLYNNVVDYATIQLGVPVVAKAFVGDGQADKVAKIQSKFGKPRFVEYCTGSIKTKEK